MPVDYYPRTSHNVCIWIVLSKWMIKKRNTIKWHSWFIANGGNACQQAVFNILDFLLCLLTLLMLLFVF